MARMEFLIQWEQQKLPGNADGRKDDAPAAPAVFPAGSSNMRRVRKRLPTPRLKLANRRPCARLAVADTFSAEGAPLDLLA